MTRRRTQAENDGITHSLYANAACIIRQSDLDYFLCARMCVPAASFFPAMRSARISITDKTSERSALHFQRERAFTWRFITSRCGVM